MSDCNEMELTYENNENILYWNWGTYDLWSWKTQWSQLSNE